MTLPNPPKFVIDADLLASPESRRKLFSILEQCDNDRVKVYVVNDCIESVCSDKKINFDSIKSSLEDHKITVVDPGNPSPHIEALDETTPDWCSNIEVDYAIDKGIRTIITDKQDDFSNLDKIQGLRNFALWRLDRFGDEVKILPPEATPGSIDIVSEISKDPILPPPPPGKKKKLTIIGIGFIGVVFLALSLIKGSSNQPKIKPELVVGDDISRGEEMLPLPPLSNKSCKIERQSNEEVRSATAIFQNVYNQKNSETSDQKKYNYKDALDNFDKAITKDAKSRIYDPELSIYQQNAYAHSVGDVLTIAVVVPFSEKKRDGSTNYESYCNRTVPILRGVAMAQKEINTGKAININGKHYYLAIVIANDENDKNYKAKNIAQALVKDKTILGVIGHDSSSATSEALKEYNNNLIVVTSTNTALSKEIKEDKNNSFRWFRWFYPQNVIRWSYRTVIPDEIPSQKLADYVKEKKKNKVSIIVEKGDKDSEGYLEYFQNQTNFSQENIVKIFEFDSQQKRIKDFQRGKEISPKDIVKNSIDGGVQSILIFTQSQDTKDFVLEVMKENTILNHPLVILGGNSLYECDKLGKNSEGLILSVPWFQGSNDKTKSFNEKASKKWKGDINWRTATSYDAVKVFYQAFSNLENVTREALADEMQQGIDIPPDDTSGDPLKFDNSGERLGNISSGFVQVKKSNKKGCGGYSFEKVD